ncbi:uncharacterized protein [Lolium perenne]|uniref:uncharacterized protein n=1 Tax=Lolium perenne TaxID=4522 RepID=UPI003A99E018
MQAFRDALNDCGLEDLGFIGEKFTWKRGRIRERLDRVVANGAWSVMHPGAIVQHMDYTRSDHRPIILDIDYQNMGPQSREGPWRFEVKWLREKGFRETVQQAMASAAVAPSVGVLGKLGHMHNALHAWDRAVLKEPKHRLRQTQNKLEKTLNGPMTTENEVLAKEMADLVELLLEQEEIHWLQRSRANWLQSGDRNTSFFHNFASARRKKNHIKKLLNDDNVWVEGTAPLKALVLNYFSNMFTSEVQDVDPMVLEKINPRIDDAMNEKLMFPFSAEEVKKAMFNIGDFKQFWDLCGQEITEEVLQAVNSGVIP